MTSGSPGRCGTAGLWLFGPGIWTANAGGIGKEGFYHEGHEEARRDLKFEI